MAVFSGASCSAVGNRRRCTSKQPARLHRRPDRLVRRTQPAMYCASNARRAAATVGPIPTPSSTFGLSRAIQSSPRTDNWGRRTADGAPWMRCTVLFHLLDCRGCIIDDASSTGRIIVFVRPESTTRACRKLDGIFSEACGDASVSALTGARSAPEKN